jgi:lysophospholipase L1-like esterase
MTNSEHHQPGNQQANGPSVPPSFDQKQGDRMNHVISRICLLAAFVGAAVSWTYAEEPGAVNTAPLRLVVIGDSTVCNFPADNPCRGWGQYLQPYFKDSVRVVNLAQSGRSTKTFIKEGLWKKALAQKPNFVLIQFGHNDSHGPDRPESTDAATAYKDYLRQYVSDCRAHGATPIFVTSMHRRTFGRDGKLQDSLRPYAEAMKQVAAEHKVAVIDLHASSGALFQKLGPVGCPKLANQKGDCTHFNEKGAKAMAELVMEVLPKVEPRLAKELKHSARDSMKRVGDL